ncbi:class F sortase [Streptosporangium sp. NPDC020072]|uniref:class F sortase n=1 Tax=Streptosporangium sp. NPDC020072 TaxID=3154788 RepID=UPI0034275436
MDRAATRPPCPSGTVSARHRRGRAPAGHGFIHRFVLLWALALAAGCGAVPGGGAVRGPARSVAAQAGSPPGERAVGGPGWPAPITRPLGRAEPTRVVIPRIGVDAPLVVLGVEGDGRLAVPPLDHADAAGWYGGGPAPGESGSAVIVGHLDTRTGPAVFARLGELDPGDAVGVVRADGTVAVFAVERVEQAPKAHFPAERVYGPTDGRRLRLVTCGGSFDQVSRSYADNVIVHARYRAGYRASDLRYSE